MTVKQITRAYMPDFSDSYCEVKANLPWNCEIYHEIESQPMRFFHENFLPQMFNISKFFRDAFTVAKTNENWLWTSKT